MTPTNPLSNCCKEIAARTNRNTLWYCTQCTTLCDILPTAPALPVNGDEELEKIIRQIHFSSESLDELTDTELYEDTPVECQQVIDEAKIKLSAWRDHTQAQGTDLAAQDPEASTGVSSPPKAAPSSREAELDEAFSALNGSGAHACYCPRSEDGGCTCVLKDEYILKVKTDILAAVAQQVEAAFQRGRIAEAKVCEEAKRHQVEAAVQAKAHHVADLARAVGLLEGLNYSDEYLTKRLNKIQAELPPTPLQKDNQ